MARVFLVEPVRRDFDLESLKSFGEIIYLFEPDERRGSVFRTDEFCINVTARLKRARFDAVNDFFCLTGALVPTCLVMSLIANAHSTINILLYNTGDESYASRKVVYEAENTTQSETQAGTA